MRGSMRAADWGALLQPSMRRHPSVVELQGGYKPPPIPPGWDPGASSRVQLQRLEVVEPYGYLKSQGSSGSWGRNVDGPFPAENGSIVVAQSDQFPGPPRPITVHLLRSDVNPVTAGFAMLRAKVTYGVGGAQNVFECDWVQGGQFTLNANSITVEARAVRPAPDLPYAPDNQNIILGASFGLEAASPPRPPTLTAPYLTLVSPGQIVFPIPDFARRAIPLLQNEGGGAAPFDVWRVRFLTGGLTALVDYPMTEAIVYDGLDIPAFARFFGIFSATQTQSCGAMFELGL